MFAGLSHFDTFEEVLAVVGFAVDFEYVAAAYCETTHVPAVLRFHLDVLNIPGDEVWGAAAVATKFVASATAEKLQASAAEAESKQGLDHGHSTQTMFDFPAAWVADPSLVRGCPARSPA